MLCDSTSPLLKNASVKMPESLQKLISRMHSAKKRRILAPNALPVKRQNCEERKRDATKLCSLTKPKRSGISLRHSAPSKNPEKRNPSQTYDNSARPRNSPISGQPSFNSEKSSIDSTQSQAGIPSNPFAESTNTPKITAYKNGASSFSTPRRNSFTYPSELTTETGTDLENVAVKFKPNNIVDRDSNVGGKNPEHNVEPADSENVKPSNESNRVDSTVIVTNEASPINRNAHTLGIVSATPSGRQTVYKSDCLATPVNCPPLDTAAIKSSLKTRSCGVKKWVTFNDIVQAESQTHFINDFSPKRLKTNNSKPKKMLIDIQPIFVDDFYTHQSHCTQAVDTTCEFTQISGHTTFVDDLYADSPKTDDTKLENEDINSSDGNKMQNILNVLRRINNNITKATSDISKMSLFFESYKDGV